VFVFVVWFALVKQGPPIGDGGRLEQGLLAGKYYFKVFILGHEKAR